MASDYIRQKHLVKTMGRKYLREILEDSLISPREARAFEMFVFEEHDIGFIGDTLGWCYSACQRHIAKAVKTVCARSKNEANPE